MYCNIQNRTAVLYSISAFACLFLIFCLSVYVLAADDYRVVIVHSYNDEYIWTRQINKGIEVGFAGHCVVDNIFYMDAKRHPSPVHLGKISREIIEYIEQTRPQAVICVDDPAQKYLSSTYLKGRKMPQVIFCGVNAPLEKYGFPASNVSGVRERWHCREAFALMKKILPQAQTVAFLVEDSESGGYVLEDLLVEQAQNGAYDLELMAAEKIHTLKQWKNSILEYNEKADVLALGLYNSIVDEESGKVVPPDVLMDWTNSVITKPTIGFADVAKEHGLLCGILESGYEQGLLAGTMVRKLQEKGLRAGDLPVTINSNGIVFLNLKTAEKLGIQIPYEFIEAAGEIIQ